jgi:hypothetical protein
MKNAYPEISFLNLLFTPKKTIEFIFFLQDEILNLQKEIMRLEKQKNKGEQK